MGKTGFNRKKWENTMRNRKKPEKSGFNWKKNENEKNQKHLKRCRYTNNMETIQKTSEKSNIINMEKYNSEKNENEKNQKHLKRCRYTNNMETIQKTSEKSNIINMEKSSLEKMSKSELIDLLLEQISNKRPIPAPRKSVKLMAQKYEENVIKPIPKPRTQKSIDAYIPSKLTQSISQMQQALEGYTKSFNIELRVNKDPLVQLQKSRKAIEYLFNDQLKIFKGFKYVETLQVKFIKFSNGRKTEKNGFFNSKADLILNNADIQASLEISKQHILNIISQWVSEGSGWTVESIGSHHLNIANYSPLKGSSYIELPSEIKKSQGLINIKNTDNECFRWCHIRHLNPQKKIHKELKKLIKNLLKN